MAGATAGALHIAGIAHSAVYEHPLEFGEVVCGQWAIAAELVHGQVVEVVGASL